MVLYQKCKHNTVIPTNIKFTVHIVFKIIFWSFSELVSKWPAKVWLGFLQTEDSTKVKTKCDTATFKHVKVVESDASQL